MAMRKLHLPMNQTQKVRYDRAIELHLPIKLSTAENCVILGDSIPFNHDKGAVLRGHGASEEGELEATVCGVVERLNNHVHVRHLRARYTPKDKDIVVGRVIEVVDDKLWRVDLNSSRNIVLLPKFMNTNRAVQRRTEDELNLRNILVPHDVVCAQVCNNKNGSVELHADISHQYGKLEKGQLLKVDPYLVMRSKNHIHYLENLGINLILGLNGFLWVGECVQVRDPPNNIGKEQSHTPLETRQSICKAANAIRVLSNLGFTITREVVEETVNLSNTNDIDIHDMLGSEFHVLVAENETEKRGAYRRKPKSLMRS